MALTRQSSSRVKRRSLARASRASRVAHSRDGLTADALARKRAARLDKLLAERGLERTRLSLDLTRPGQGKRREIKFGHVTVTNTPPDIDTVTANINAGQLALKRATAVLTNPGVKLDLGAEVPRFSVDAARPGLLVRELDGITETGRIVDGAFVPLG